MCHNTRDVSNVYEIFVSKPEREILYGGPSHRQQGSITVCLKEIECEGTG
jgi:hypothetical protein